MKNKKGNAVLLFIIIVGAVLVGGYFLKGDFSLPKSVDKTTKTCTGGDTFSLMQYCQDAETGLANTDEFVYRINGEGAWRDGACGTALTSTQGLGPGMDVEIVIGVNAESEQAFAQGPYIKYENLDCKTTNSVDVYADETYDGMSATFYNEDNNAAAQSGSAASSHIIHLKLKAANNEMVGNPFLDTAPIPDNGKHRKEYPNMICINLNSTSTDDPNWAKVNGVTMNRVSSPTVHSGEASHVTYCYELPVIGEEPIWFDISLDMGDSVALAEDDNWNIYSGTWYIHHESGELEWGVETSDGAFVGFSQADTVANDFT